MSTAPESATPEPPPRRALWRRRLAYFAVTSLLASGLATLYGLWLDRDSVLLPKPVDAVVSMGGYHRHELAVEWLKQGLCREIWVLVPPEPILVRLGVEQPGVEVTRQQLIRLGAPLDRVREFRIRARDRHVPDTIRDLGELCERQNAQRVLVTCEALEARPLRQIANAALSPNLRSRIQFLSMASDRYQASWWWLSRTGMKECWNQSIQVLSNWWDGPTAGFESIDWHPETWEPPPAEAVR